MEKQLNILDFTEKDAHELLIEYMTRNLTHQRLAIRMAMITTT